MLYAALRPLLFTLDAEHAHRLTIAGLKAIPHAPSAMTSPILASKVAGIDFPNPVGLAPGFDKDAEVAGKVARLGFGFAEVGTLTPLPQSGNPPPRLFRLTEDRAVINRMGFNNRGQAEALPRLKRLHRDRPPIPVGVNIGANRDAIDRVADYANGVRALADFADYLTVNISSPNTPGLRALQDKNALDALLGGVMEARGSHATPIFLKVAPDLEPADIDDIVGLAHTHRLDALIVSNTTLARPPLKSRHAREAGGLSGDPLRDLAHQRLKDFRSAGTGAIPLIGVGGIASGADAYARIRAGASLVQLYSALAFEGPWLARRINRDLAHLLTRDGFTNVAQAVGADAA